MRVSFNLLIALLLAATVSFPARSDDSASSPLPHEVVINGVELVLIPEGWFWYGVENGSIQHAVEAGRPVYRDVKIWLDAFYIAKFEARARDFKRFMESHEVKHREDYWRGDKGGCAVRRNAEGEYYLIDNARDLPATHLSWNLADEFARWMGLRLPKETEWVKAARGTDRRIWPWGDEYPDDTFAAYAGNGDCNPLPVDAYSKGASPYGAYGMAGNVYEQVADWYNEEYDLALKDGDRNPPLATEGTSFPETGGARKLLKSGRWASSSSATTIYERVRVLPTDTFICWGTRFAADVATVRAHLEDGTATIVRP